MTGELYWWNVRGCEIRGHVYRTPSGKFYGEVADTNGHIYWNDYSTALGDMIPYVSGMVCITRSAVAHGLVIDVEDQLLVDVNRELAHACS